MENSQTTTKPTEVLNPFGLIDPRYFMNMLHDPAALAFLQQQPFGLSNGGGKMMHNANVSHNSFRISDLIEKPHNQRSNSSSNGSDKANTSGENESLEDETFENGPNWNNTSTDNGSRSPTSTPGAHSSSKKARKARTIFTDKQLQELETMFDKHKYLSVQDRMELAQRMGLTDTQVKTWYQNRRTKWKRQAAVGVDLLNEPANFAVIQNLLRTNPYWSQQYLSNPAMFPLFGQRLMPSVNPLQSPTPSTPNAASTNPFMLFASLNGLNPSNLMASLMNQNPSASPQNSAENSAHSSPARTLKEETVMPSESPKLHSEVDVKEE